MIAFSVFFWPIIFHSMDPNSSVIQVAFYLSPFRDVLAPMYVGAFWVVSITSITMVKGLLTGQLIILKDEGDRTDGRQ